MPNALKKDSKKEFYIILSLTIFFLAVGLLMMYSSGHYNGEKTYSDKFVFVKKQLVGIAVGIIPMVFLIFYPYQKLKKFVTPLIIATIVMLVLVFIPGIGVENYGAKRWIKLGFFTIQPSDIGKFTFILFASFHLSKEGKTVKSKLPIYFLGGVFAILIFLEPNLSITICMCLLVLSYAIMSGIKGKTLLSFCALGLAILPVLIIMEPYRLKRLFAFVDPFASPKNEGYQLIQSLYSLASGGLFGVGLFSSRQAFRFLPFGESDFIFAIFSEEFGFLGGLFLILCYMLFVYCGFKIALKSKDKLGFLLCFGGSVLVAIQSALNMAVVIGLIPPTGLPLPFISSGNTQIIMFMSVSGLLLGVSRNQS